MRFLKANKLFNGRTYLAGEMVLVLDKQNLLKDIVPENTLDSSAIERLEGIITPGFVNAHCHLELSHLKNKIPQHTGLSAFAKQVIAQRNNLSKEEISSHMQDANLEMWNNGIVAVGDISNTEDSFEEKINSKIYYHTFLELIGLNPTASEIIFEKGNVLLEKLRTLKLPGSLAPHAPYSTSKELIRLISNQNNLHKRSLSIHNQESEEETKFFKGLPNAFNDLYKGLGLDISWFNAPGKSSFQYYMDALSHNPSILVHNTFTDTNDMEAAKNKNIYWCFCPGANKYIENRLPNFSVFKNKKDRICLGTDSLASNSQLNLIAEANLICQNETFFILEDLLRAMTFNGAEALGLLEDFGQFMVGKNTGLNLITYKDSKINFIKKIS